MASAPAPSHAPPSPLLKAAVTVAAGTALLCGLLVYRQLHPARRAQLEPPPLEASRVAEVAPIPESEAVAETAPRNVVAPPEPAAVPLAAPPAPPPVTEVPVNKVPRSRLEQELMAAQNTPRKLALMRRLEKEGGRSAKFAVATFFPDGDKQVRLEALRIVEKMDKDNEVLMPKLRAVYLYEQDPEVKAQFDRLVQHYRPIEEAELRAEEAQAQAQARQLPQ